MGPAGTRCNGRAGGADGYRQRHHLPPRRPQSATPETGRQPLNTLGTGTAGTAGKRSGICPADAAASRTTPQNPGRTTGPRCAAALAATGGAIVTGTTGSGRQRYAAVRGLSAGLPAPLGDIRRGTELSSVPRSY